MRRLRGEIETALPELVAEIDEYWEIALAPSWPRIRTVLEADIFHRARQPRRAAAAGRPGGARRRNGVGAACIRTLSEAVAAVIGRSRTLLLAELEAPASTSELATRTGMSPGGISEHLTALRGAGMVNSHRSGRSVLYARAAVADSPLAASV